MVDISRSRLELSRELKIADNYQVVPPTKHSFSVVANSYFDSYLEAINATENNGYVILFSGINTKEIEDDRWKSLTHYIEKLHRYGGHALYTNKNDATLMLLGSSGYNRDDIAYSTALLMEKYPGYYEKIQTGVVDGLDADFITTTGTQSITQVKDVLPTLLNPTSLSSGSHEGIVENNLKVLIKVK